MAVVTISFPIYISPSFSSSPFYCIPILEQFSPSPFLITSDFIALIITTVAISVRFSIEWLHWFVLLAFRFEIQNYFYLREYQSNSLK